MVAANRAWMAEKARRYLSAHVHVATNLREEAGVRELKIGSTLDWPPQAAMLVLGARPFAAQAIGAETETPGFVAPCSEKRAEWALPDHTYRAYLGAGAPYAVSVLTALGAALPRQPEAVSVSVPDSTHPQDWGRLAELLELVQGSSGQARAYWAWSPKPVRRRRERGRRQGPERTG